MRNLIPSSRRAITLAVMAGLSLPVVAQDNPVEEVVVTGSYFRGSPLDAPSPVQVIDRSSIEAQGAAVIWDVIKNLEVNSGSITNPGSDNGQVEGTANVNLRNLGENSTLTLINGKRMVPAAATTQSGGEFVDLNSIPLVMTDRVEVLTDGGSALYGADAVAGVVNIIMRNDFEGLELYGDLQGVEQASGAYDATVSGIWGTSFNDGATHLVLSAERFERDPVAVKDANFYGPYSEFLGTVSDAGTLINAPAFGANFNAAQWLNTEIYTQNLAEGGNPANLITPIQAVTRPRYQTAALRRSAGSERIVAKRPAPAAQTRQSGITCQTPLNETPSLAHSIISSMTPPSSTRSSVTPILKRLEQMTDTISLEDQPSF